MRSAKIFFLSFIILLTSYARLHQAQGGEVLGFHRWLSLHLTNIFDRREHKDPPVACAVRAGVVHPHDDEDMLKVRADDLGSEGMSAGLLEHDGHDVVPYVPLPQQLVVKEQGAPRQWDTADFQCGRRVVRLFFGGGPAGSSSPSSPAVCCWACTAAGSTRGT